jgi:HAD superfamily hydrolase (TIGR01509 family)
MADLALCLCWGESYVTHMISCILFDLDGTLVDSEPLCSRAYLSLIPELKLTEAQMMQRFRGREFNSILQSIEAHIGKALPAGFQEVYRAEVKRLFQLELKAFPGVAEALQQLQDRGMTLCIASSGPQAKIAAALDLTGLSAFFGARIYSAYDIERWKPDPALFCHAAEQQNVAPEDTLVFEDSDVGAMAAQAAGMHCLLHAPHEITLPKDVRVAGVFQRYESLLPNLVKLGFISS